VDVPHRHREQNGVNCWGKLRGRRTDMLRTALLCGVFARTLGVGRAALADTVLYCVPDEPRVTAPDRLVSVEVKILPNGNFASVVYRAANGATYDRGAQ